MPAGAMGKRLLLSGALVLVILAITGFVVGAIGSGMLGRSEPFLPQPEIHLPPQPIFPAAKRDASLGLVAAAAPEAPATEPAEPINDDHATSEEEHHFVPLGVTEVALTNTLLSAWVATFAIILFFVLGSRRRALVPSRFQGLIESVMEAMLTFATGVLGPEMARKAFPVAATIFFFVLFNAWIVLFLIPIYASVGFGTGSLFDMDIKTHLLRPAGTDLNMPLALALISFVFVEYWGFRVNGFGYLKKFFAFGNLLRGRPSGIIDVFVGILEFISELVRVVSFTFRLFGNMMAGEILVVMVTFLVPFAVNIFVFGLELLVGLIQSVIFAGLTLVFLNLAVSHEKHAEHAEH